MCGCVDKTFKDNTDEAEDDAGDDAGDGKDAPINALVTGRVAIWAAAP